MNRGWIKLHRQFLEWEWYDEPNCTRVFLHCLLKANHKSKRYRGTVIERGTFVTSLDIFAREINLTVQKLRTAFSKLESTGEIKLNSNTRGTVVTVCNYDGYQDTSNEDNKPITNKEQTDNKQVTTTKNENNKKNDKKYITPSVSDVSNYFLESGKVKEEHIQIEAENFYNHYDELDWKRRGKKIQNWKRQASTWANNYIKYNNNKITRYDEPF